MPEPRAQGFTLIELVMVLLILTVIAASLSTGPPGAESESQLDVTAEQVAMALRHARSEALRTGEARSASVSRGDGRVYAATPDFASGTLALGSLLRNPFDQRPYDFRIGAIPGAPGVAVADADEPFAYRGLAARQSGVAFDAAGYPYYLKDGVRHALVDGAVTLRHGGVERSVSLSPLGRVTVQ